MAKLGDVCSLITDGSHFSPKDIGTGYPMLSVKDMKEKDFSFDGCKHISEEDYQTLLRNGCQPKKGDVLLAKDGSYFKYAFIVEEERELAVLSSIAILRPKVDIIDPRYLREFLMADSTYKTVSLNYISGTALKRVILQGIKKINVPLPAIEDQRKIAEKFIKLDQLIALRKEQLAKLDQLAKSRFVELFESSELSAETTIEAITEQVKVGFVGTCEKYYTDESGVPMLRTGNITEKGIDLKDLKYVTREFHEKNKKSQIHTGDLLIARHGSNGQANVYSGPEAQCLNAVVIVPNQSIASSIFLAGLINSPMVKEQIERTLVGSTQRVVNTKSIANLKVKVPSITVQRQYEEFVEQTDKSKLAIQQSLDKLETLKKSLMQEYFG